MKINLFLSFLLVSVLAYGQKGKDKSQNMDPLDVTQLSESDALKAETMLIEAEKEVILENYDDAISLFKAALEINKNNAVLNFKIAEVMSKRGDQQNALPYATRAVELDKTNKYYLLLAGEINKSLSNYEAAAKIYQQMIDDISGTESYLYDLAIIYQYLGKDQKALATYKRAEDYFGMNEMVLYEKQKIYIKNKDMKSLIADWDKLIAENDGQDQYILNLSEFLISKGMYDDAKVRLGKLKNRDDANVLLSQIALNSGKLEEAMALAKQSFAREDLDFQSKLKLLNSFMERAISPEDFEMIAVLATDLAGQYPEQYEVQAYAGDIMKRIEENSLARDFYLKAVNLEASNFVIWQNIIVLEANMNEYDSVIVHGEQALEYFPNQAVFYYYLGTGYLIKKNFKRSIQTFDTGKKYVTDDKLLTVFYGQMGDGYNSLQQHEKSYNAYEKALEIDPENDHVLNNYSYFLSIRKKDLDLASKMSTKLVGLHPDNPTYLDTHGWVLYTQKKYEEAAIYLEKAATLEQDGTIIEHYGDVLYKLGKIDEAIIQWKHANKVGGASENIQKKIAEGKLYE